MAKHFRTYFACDEIEPSFGRRYVITCLLEQETNCCSLSEQAKRRLKAGDTVSLARQ